MKKRKSPILDMTTLILDEVTRHNGLVHLDRKQFISLLKSIEWNLLQSGLVNQFNLGQALGLTRGALRMMGQEEQKV